MSARRNPPADAHRAPEAPADRRLVHFVVYGPPIGAVRMNRYGKHTNRSSRCHAYMEQVKWEARRAGLRLPLKATEAAPVMVSSRCVFVKRVHPDTENVQKLICDALFYGAKGGDKYVGGSYEPPEYGTAPFVEVTVEMPTPGNRAG